MTRCLDRRETTMNAADILREFAYPARNLTVMLSAAFIFLMLEFAAFGGLLGLFLAFLILPSLFHYLMRVLDRRARGKEPGPLEVDDLYWFQGAWSLFMIVHVAIAYYAIHLFGDLYGRPGWLIATVLLSAVLPASLAVLAITRSPIESLNPRAIGGLIGRAGGDYWILPTYILVAAFAVNSVAAAGVPGFFTEMIAFYLVLVFFSMTGAVVQSYELHEEVDIHEAVEKPREAVDEALLNERTSVLNHAYGFISRDNRAGGFRHIEGWLQRDPDPEAAWAWFLDQMLRWEDSMPALLFAQSYLRRLLMEGDDVTAVKIMGRCRHVNPDFVPLADDIGPAIEAAERRQNQELADFLRSRV
jgi:hypothetical protein